MNTKDRPPSGAPPTSSSRPSGFNKAFLAITAVALVAWVVFLLVVALKY